MFLELQEQIKYPTNEFDKSFSLQNFPANKIFVIEIYSNEETSFDPQKATTSRSSSARRRSVDDILR